MGKIYIGYELMQAIAEGKIEEGTRFEFINNINGAAITVIILKDSMNKFVLKNEDCDDYLHANWLVDTTIKQLEDEIDIQEIEEMEEFKLDEFINMSNRERFDKTMIEYSKINKILQWAKQIDKKINTKHCESCGAELTKENTALSNMCWDCKYGEEKE